MISLPASTMAAAIRHRFEMLIKMNISAKKDIEQIFFILFNAFSLPLRSSLILPAKKKCTAENVPQNVDFYL
jgi:hypothetical protein